MVIRLSTNFLAAITVAIVISKKSVAVITNANKEYDSDNYPYPIVISAK